MLVQMIRLVLLAGEPTALRFVQLAGRTTRVTACPMATRSDIYQRPEGDKPAVYILTGPDPDGLERLAVYVGECDSFSQRFRGKHHAQERAEWSEVFVATTTDGTLNKAHALFAENILRQAIVSAGLATSFTERTLSPTLDEGDRAFAAAFAEDVVMLLKVLGLDIFSARHRASYVSGKPVNVAMKNNGSDESVDPAGELPIFVYETKGVRGRMQPSGSSFVVLAGSTLSKEETKSIPEKAKRIREDGLKSGLISNQNGAFIVEKDIPVGNISLAGSIVSGNAMAGRDLWRLESSNTTYREWDEQRNSVKDTTRDGEGSVDAYQA